MSAADPIAALAEIVLPYVNSDHADSMLFIAQVLGDRPDATSAVATGVDRLGMELTVDGGDALRVEFPEPADDLFAMQMQALALVQAARARSGRAGSTNLEREAAAMASISTFVTSVVAVRQLTPGVRRITFGGGDLARFSPLAPDQFLYLLLPPPGRDQLTVDASFTWTGYEEMPEEERPVGAYYTVRAWRPDAVELDMDFVLHTPSGHACQWAARAKAGDPVALWGPRTSFEPPAGTDWYLLVADDTGVPALSGILDSLPAGTPVRAFAEVAGAEEVQALRADPATELRWFTRDGAEPGTTTALLDAVRALPFPEGNPYVWGGAESKTLTAIRKHLRHEVGLPRESVSLVGYWRRGELTPDELEG